MPKRVMPSPNKTAKKAKTASSPGKASKAPEAPLLAVLAHANHVPKECREMLSTALPYALATPTAERHKFQIEVLSGISKILAEIEEQKRTVRGEAVAQVASLQADKDVTAADVASKVASADAKKTASDEKNKLYDEAAKAVEVAAQGLKDAQDKLSDCEAKKKQILVDQEDFKKLLSDLYEPLKTGAFSGHEWRKRNKMITELLKSIRSKLTVEEALLDGLDAVLKTKPDQREPFASVTLEFTDKTFSSHAEKMTQDAAALDEEVAGHTKAIEAAEGLQEQMKTAKDQAEKAWDAETNEWVDLENAKAKAEQHLKKLDTSLVEANEEVESANEDLEKFLEVPALFEKLKDFVEAELTEPAEQTEPAEAEPAQAPDSNAAAPFGEVAA